MRGVRVVQELQIFEEKTGSRIIQKRIKVGTDAFFCRIAIAELLFQWIFSKHRHSVKDSKSVRESKITESDVNNMNNRIDDIA